MRCVRKLPRAGGRKMSSQKSEYDYMKEADEKEEDAYLPEEWAEEKTQQEEYFEFYDDIKTDIKEDW